MKHPTDRKVFFVRGRDEFISLNEIRDDVKTGKLAIVDFVFDVDGSSYTVENIMLGKAPEWALSAENDPMLHGLPPLSEEDIAMTDELMCEEGFIEMPDEPKAKTVEDYLANEPRIARMVHDAECFMFR